MKGKYILPALVSTLLLVGCGGGGSGEGSTTQNDAFDAANLNGVYVNSNDGGLLVVDSTRSEYPVFGADLVADIVFFVDSATTSTNNMKTKGLTAATTNTWAYDGTIETNIAFSGSTATTSIEVDGTQYDYTLEKTADSMALTELEGTYTNPDNGSTWTFFTDGSFVINASCTISGNMERKGAYFNITNAQAVSCSDTAFNGNYNTGAVVTVTYQGQQYVAGIIGNDTAIIWGNAPIN